MEKDYSAKELQELAGVSEGNACICEKEERPVLNQHGYFSHYKKVSPRYHQDDCPRFEDYSHGTNDTDYVW